MLFTRCPDCETTFQVTASALLKAVGKVRCDQCDTVFVVDNELSAATVSTITESDIDVATEIDSEDESAIEIKSGASATDDGSNEEDEEDEQDNETVYDDHEIGSRSSALAEITQGPEASKRSGHAWVVGAALLSLFLAAQATHVFRAKLSTQPVVGSMLQSIYAHFGLELIPKWNLSQYEILDWVARTEPSQNGSGTMNITTKIRNNGPAEQPYPNIHLQLKNRWDQTVGSRIFSPPEYLPMDHVVTELMGIGTTIRAEFDLIDWAEEAYGFELDVCLDAPSGGLTCVADTIFH